MITEEDVARIVELKAQIKKYDTQYYEEGVSEISDAEYDRLYDEYLEFESIYPQLKSMDDAPTKRVGAGDVIGTTNALPKYTHKSPLLSIDRKAKDIEELKDFFEKCGGNGTEFIIEPKLDGITCNINYEDGKFVNAATRGNGYIGDLITDNFKMTDTQYPNIIPDSHNLELRGEAIIPYDYFNKHLVDRYGNPRNAVSGIMRQIEAKEVNNKGVQVMFYDIGKTNMSLDDNDLSNLYQILRLHFQTIPAITVSTWDELKYVVESNMNNSIQNIDGFNVLMTDGKFPQAVCDGLVIKVNSRKKREEIGMSEKGPKWAFAYKFKPLQAETRIDHIEWQVGKSGRITPVAIFDEISLGGTRITRATLNNYDYMKNLPVLDSKEKGLQMDDLIIVERSNDVIPRIVAIKKRQKCLYQQDMESTRRVTERLNSFKVPKFCPDCGQSVTTRYPLHYCDNPLCPSQMKAKIGHYASRDAMNIVGLGEGIINILYNNGLLSDILSIYSLPFHRTELENLSKFGKRKVEKLLHAIEDSKSPELWQFIYSLSIEGVGHKASKDLAQRYHTLDNFLLATEEELFKIDDIGEIIVGNIIDYLSNNDIKKMIHELRETGIVVKSVQIEGDKLKGKTFVITGTLSKPRKYYQEIIEKNGGKVSGSVSKKTTAVLIGADAGSKEEKARKLVSEGNDIVLLDTESKIEDYIKPLASI